MKLSPKTRSKRCDISRFVSRITIAVLLLALPAFGQHQHMSGPPDPVSELLLQQVSGTASNPGASSMQMAMNQWEKWMLMWHGEAFVNQVVETDDGGQKLFSTNWLMGMADRPLGGGHLLLRSMLSLEPATIGESGYPQQFQTGEGLINHQHAHDLFMELAAEFAVEIAPHTVGYVYAAPVGSPALGPVAFPHRASAIEIPQAPLGHHLQDATHIASSVLTIGAKHEQFAFEVSGFHGREPDNDNRWDIDRGGIDSWAMRATWTPSPNWSAQISTGHISDPEPAEPGDIQRTTISASYVDGDWASTVAWGWNHLSSSDPNGLLAESTLRFNTSNYVTGRLEILKKDEFPDTIFAITGGYTKDIYRSPALLGGIGGNVTVNHSGGDSPLSFYVFVRVRSLSGM